MAYTTAALVTDWLSATYNTTTQLSTAQVTALIAQADQVVDATASRHYYKFNAVDSAKTDGTDTYTTPKVVSLASRHLTASMCWPQIRAKTGNSAFAEAMQWELDQAQYYLSLLAARDIRNELWTYRNETLTFGTNATSWDLNIDEAKIGAATILDSGDPPHVLEDSVAISSSSTTDGTFTAAQAALMRNGVDYAVYWSDERRSWIFKALTGDITSHISTLKVTYNWTYERDFGVDASVSGVCFAG